MSQSEVSKNNEVAKLVGEGYSLQAAITYVEEVLGYSSLIPVWSQR